MILRSNSVVVTRYENNPAVMFINKLEKKNSLTSTIILKDIHTMLTLSSATRDTVLTHIEVQATDSGYRSSGGSRRRHRRCIDAGQIVS